MKRRLFTYSTLCGTGLLFACASPAPVSTLPVQVPLNAASQAERPDGYYQLGRFYQGQNRVDQAIDAYRKALALDRNFTDAHNALGALYAAQGRLDEAVAEFTIVVAALPMTSYAWNNLGYAYLLQGKSGDAVAALERATAFDLTNQRAWNNLGTALAQRGDSAAASEKFARAAELAAAVSTASPAPVRAASPAAAPVIAPATALATPPVVVPPIAMAAIATAAPTLVAAPGATPAAAPVASPAAVVTATPDASPVATLVVAPVAIPAAASPAAVPAATFALSPAASPLAAPAVIAPTGAPINAVDPVQLDKLAEASAPIELGPQPAAFDSGKETGSFASAIVDNTGASELVQLAPSVYELRLAPQTIAAQSYRLELSNGNGVTGMARRLGEQLIAKGLPKARLTNQKPFRQRLTQIQYRDGYADVAAALRSRMPNQPPIIKTAALRASTDVRVVLGRDLPRDVALLDAAPEGAQVADASRDAGNGAE
jgi:TPR repeat/LytR cell envelope-related transcriptional attenuator/Tetratricopeptide repeat